MVADGGLWVERPQKSVFFFINSCSINIFFVGEVSRDWSQKLLAEKFRFHNAQERWWQTRSSWSFFTNSIAVIYSFSSLNFVLFPFGRGAFYWKLFFFAESFIFRKLSHEFGLIFAIVVMCWANDAQKRDKFVYCTRHWALVPLVDCLLLVQWLEMVQSQQLADIATLSQGRGLEAHPYLFFSNLFSVSLLIRSFPSLPLPL